MAKHRVKLLQQPSAGFDRGLSEARLVRLRLLYKRLHRLFGLRQELVQRSIQQADRHRQSFHNLEQFIEVLGLVGPQVFQCLGAQLIGVRQNEVPKTIDPRLIEEHVLGATETDTLRLEHARQLRIPRLIRVGVDIHIGEMGLNHLQQLEQT